MKDKRNVRAFKGIRYETKVAGDLSKLLAPPYDVISSEQQNKFYKSSENNIIRLILGKKYDDDKDTNNRYTRSAESLKEMLDSGALIQDVKNAIYVCTQTFDVEGVTKTRVGFIARKKLEEFGGSIIPHEKTLSGPKTDRLNLTRACKCNFSQIFGLYTDEEKVTDKLLAEVLEQEPNINVMTEDGLRQKLWVVTNEEWIDKLTLAMEDKSVLIADGHHRYETALNYYNEGKAESVSTEERQCVMMYLTNTESEGMTILPTHRLIFNIKDFNADSLLEKLSSEFVVETIKSDGDIRNETAEKDLLDRLKGNAGHRFGLYAGGGKYYLLKYESKDTDNPLDRLDVGILHNKILEAHLGIGPKELAAQSNVKYSQGIKRTAGRVDEEEFQLAFFLNSTPVADMKMVTDAGLKMPQKSTYFYPKLISGLVINPLY